MVRHVAENDLLKKFRSRTQFSVATVKTKLKQGIALKTYCKNNSITAERLDPETGNRYYNQDLARFLQKDPLGIAPNTFMGNQNFAPKSQYTDGGNLYEYVKSSPIKLIDPSGLKNCMNCECGKYLHIKACTLGLPKLTIYEGNSVLGSLTYISPVIEVIGHSFIGTFAGQFADALTSATPVSGRLQWTEHYQFLHLKCKNGRYTDYAYILKIRYKQSDSITPEGLFSNYYVDNGYDREWFQEIVTKISQRAASRVASGSISFPTLNCKSDSIVNEEEDFLFENEKKHSWNRYNEN